MICPYCGKEAPKVPNEVMYGKRCGISDMAYYYYKPCNAYVGCHNNARKSLGTMANNELCEWRMKAHAALDPIWR
jgi:hypothetical protein